MMFDRSTRYESRSMRRDNTDEDIIAVNRLDRSITSSVAKGKNLSQSIYGFSDGCQSTMSMRWGSGVPNDNGKWNTHCVNRSSIFDSTQDIDGIRE